MNLLWRQILALILYQLDSCGEPFNILEEGGAKKLGRSQHVYFVCEEGVSLSILT